MLLVVQALSGAVLFGWVEGSKDSRAVRALSAVTGFANLLLAAGPLLAYASGQMFGWPYRAAIIFGVVFVLGSVALVARLALVLWNLKSPPTHIHRRT